MKGYQISGRKRNDGIDLYQTPKWAIEKLLEKETFIGTITEPCSGAGAISKILESKGFTVKSSDIRNDESVYGEKGKDFLKSQDSAENIITNPPYKYALEIIEHSIQLSQNKVAMLLKLVFLESAKRFKFFQKYPLKTVYVFCKRVQMYPEGTPKPKNSGTIAYAWFVWDKSYQGKPTIEWLL